jgi:phosphoenolpyruvate synthase/pyruvate phosphate dikinase
LAKGTLRIFTTIEDLEGATFNSTDVVVLPETIAELSPVAGILTLGEGNALSHVQLLARNFGIPNVAIDQDTVDLLQELENSAVILVVDNNGNVVLKKHDEEVAALLEAGSEKSLGEVAQIEVPMPDLSVARVLPLAEIGRHLSGQLIGPKAANLGELNRLFPGRVSPALAIPFGIYAEHLQNAGLMDRVKNVFADIAANKIEKADFDAELASIRQAVAQLSLSDETRAELTAAMNLEFGEATGYGIFVRSDTNVEDLPQFTGAGLNETIPNVVGLDAQLTAISKVWSSVLSPRSVAWRASVLANPAQIYASVLLMKSVPSTKSGVLVTANLFDRAVPALTASAAWGVGGAVAGEPAESVVLYENRADAYSEAKSPYQRKLSPTGGIDWVPAEAGPVLEPGELEALRQLAAEVNEKYAPVYDETGAARPWDIEFGFIDGELTLFQIRPLVERGTRDADSVLRRLQPDMMMHIDTTQNINLDKQPGT